MQILEGLKKSISNKQKAAEGGTPEKPNENLIGFFRCDGTHDESLPQQIRSDGCEPGAGIIQGEANEIQACLYGLQMRIAADKDVIVSIDDLTFFFKIFELRRK